MKNKKKKKPSDYEYALVLGAMIGLFLLPVVSAFGVTLNLMFVKLAALFGAPLLALSGVFFAKIVFSGHKGFWQFSKFFLIGVCNTAVNIGVLNLLIMLTGAVSGWQLPLIGATAFCAAVVNSYIWNTHWTFRDEYHHSAKQFHKFLIITFSALLVNSLVIYIANLLLHGSGSPRLEANIADLIALAVSTFWNFFGYKLWVFNNNKK